MTLTHCLHSLCGYGVKLLNRNGRLVIRSTTTPDDTQTACLKAHKPLLLAILPEQTAQSPGALLDALEVYNERVAIMAESGVPMTIIEPVATAQARHMLKLITP